MTFCPERSEWMVARAALYKDGGCVYILNISTKNASVVGVKGRNFIL